MLAYIKRHRHNLIIVSLLFLILSNLGLTFAFWASSISGDSAVSQASISIGTFVPSGFTGVSKNGDTAKGWIAFENITPNSNYVQMEDIDYLGATINPIAQFNGIYNGNGFSISNFKINNGATNVGLFSINNGDISRIHVHNASIMINNYGDNMNVGIIAGQNIGNGKITSSSAQGTINTSLYTSGTGTRSLTLNAGGLTGTNTGAISKVSTQVNITTSVDTRVLASGWWIFKISYKATATNNVGGIVGNHTSTTTISESFAIGQISTSTSTSSERFAGWGENSYLSSGGLVGYSSSSTPTTNSFRTGALTYSMSGNAQNKNLGPVVGSNVVVSNSHYVTLPTGNTNTRGTETSLANLQNQTFLTNSVMFSPTVWTFSPSQYPIHKHKR